MRPSYWPRLAVLGVAALSTAVVFAQFAGVRPVPVDYVAGWDAMDEGTARKYLEVVAGEEFAGRGTGQKGYLKAADWVAGKFKEYGLKPVMPDGSYFQMVPFTEWASDPSSTMEGPGGMKLSPGDNFDSSGVRADFSGEGPISIFSGSAANLIFTAENAKGRIVIVDSADATRRQMGAATRAGAVAVIHVLKKADGSAMVSYGHDAQARGGGGGQQAGVRFQMSRARYADLRSAIGAKDGVSVFSSDQRIKISWKITKKNIGIPNVIGRLEGTDPKLKDEFIGIGCHLDHMGVSDGRIFYGADDDGSGTVAMVLAARGFASNPVKPKRSIVFMAFAAEEMGLLGSRYMANNMPESLPLDKMSCLLQMDMVGRNEEHGDEKASENVDTIHLVGSKRISTELHELTLKANEHIGFKFEYDQEDVYTRSDHAMFAEKGVPITFVFSGFHPDYHQPSDTIEKINFKKLVSAARLNYLVGQWAGSQPSLLKREVTGG